MAGWVIPDTKMSPGELWDAAYSFVNDVDPDALTWARSINSDTFKNLKSRGFLREYCYVVYASGFKASIIQDLFSDLGEAFKKFDLDALSRTRSIKKAVAVFGSERKAQNFLDGAHMIAQEGFGKFKKRLKKGGIEVLEELPGIGPITKDHLAKNIGLADVVKSDIWLVRAAELCNAASPDELIDEICVISGESRHVADVVIWYFGKERALVPL